MFTIYYLFIFIYFVIPFTIYFIYYYYIVTYLCAILLSMEFTMSKSKTGLYAMRAIAVSVVFGLCALVPFSMYVSKNYNEDGIRITTPVVSMSSTNVETYSSGDAVLDAKVAELNSLLGY